MAAKLTDAQLTAAFDRALIRGLLFCFVVGVACLVAFTSSCCGRVIIP